MMALALGEPEDDDEVERDPRVQLEPVEMLSNAKSVGAGRRELG